MNLKLLENASCEVHSQKNKENFVHENVHRLIWYVYEIIVRELRNNLDPICILIVVSALTPSLAILVLLTLRSFTTNSAIKKTSLFILIDWEISEITTARLRFHIIQILVYFIYHLFIHSQCLNCCYLKGFLIFHFTSQLCYFRSVFLSFVSR